jgi:hypothetical protein
MLVMLDPTALPITISEDPENTEAIDVANSGSEVPNATMVTPIINEGIPIANPTFSAESTNLSDAISKIVMLAKKIRRNINKCYGFIDLIILLSCKSSVIYSKSQKFQFSSKNRSIKKGQVYLHFNNVI